MYLIPAAPALPALVISYYEYAFSTARLVLTLRTKSCRIDGIVVIGGKGTVVITGWSEAAGDTFGVVIALGYHCTCLCVKADVRNEYLSSKWQIKNLKPKCLPRSLTPPTPH